MKKITRAVALLAALAMLFAVAGCGKKTPVNGESGGEGGDYNNDIYSKQLDENQESRLVFAKRELGESKDVIVMNHWEPKEDLYEIQESYEKLYGGKITIMQCSWANMLTDLSNYINSGTNVDVVLTGDGNFPVMATSGLAQPIDESKVDLNNEYWNIDSMKKTFSYNGKYYALAFKEFYWPGGNVVLFNKTMFAENGVEDPVSLFDKGNWNWDTFRQTAAKFVADTDNNGSVDQWGFDNNQNMGSIFASNTAAPVFFDGSKYQLNMSDPKILECYQLYYNMFNVDKSIPTTPYKWYQNFLNKKIAMVCTDSGTNYISFFKRDGLTDEIDFVPFPCGPSANGKYYGGGGGHTNFVIPTGAKNVDGALAFAELAVSIWNDLGKTAPPEGSSYQYTDAQKARIEKLKNERPAGSGVGSDGSYYRGYFQNQHTAFESVILMIRKKNAVSTSIETYKADMQNVLDLINQG